MDPNDEEKFSSFMPDKLDITTAKPDVYREWEKQWKTFYQLAGLDQQDDDFRFSTLRSFLSDQTLEFVDSFNTDNNNLVESVLNAFRIYVLGPSNVVQLRRNFNLRCQDEDEQFDAYLNDLLELAKNCQFCNTCQDSLIRDRIVVGLRDLDTIDKLLEEADLTLQLAIEICRADEIVKQATTKSAPRGRRRTAGSVSKLDKFEVDDLDEEDEAEDDDRDEDYRASDDGGGGDLNDDDGGENYDAEMEMLAQETEEIETKPDLDDLDKFLNADRKKRKRGPAGKKTKGAKRGKRPKIKLELDDSDEGLEEDQAGDVDGAFPCDKCKYIGKTNRHLRMHQQHQHAEVKPHPCPFCERSFGLKIRLKRHVQCVHEKLKPFQCAHCTNAFSKKSTLDIHVRSVHDKIRPFACDVCEARFTQVGHLNRHKQVIHDNYRKFKCDFCDKRCAAPVDLAKHIKNHHSEIRCNTCGMQFDRKPDLKYHLLTEHQFMKPHLCETCGNSYSTQCALNAHMAKEHGLPEIPCECRSCLNKNSGNSHELGANGASSTSPGNPNKELRRTHLCDICGKSYTQLPGLKYHMQAVHGISDKSCECDMCQEKSKNEDDQGVNRHFKQIQKHRPHKCKLCKASFTQINSLTEHIATVHCKVKRFQCDLCKSQFTSHKHLGVHVRSIHLGIKPFECPQCNAKFTQLGHRNRHILVVHEGLKKFQCDMCDKKYASKVDLKYHLKKIHGKVILFDCALCDAKFDQRKHLMAHITEVHESQEILKKTYEEAKTMV